jgi:hypothetical protein
MLWQDEFDGNEAGRAEGNGASGGLLRTVQWGARICACHVGRGPLAVPAGEHTGAEAPHHGASLIHGWHATPRRRSWARTGEMSMLFGGGFWRRWAREEGSSAPRLPGHLDWGNALERMVANRNQTNAKTKEGEEMGKLDAGSP